MKKKLLLLHLLTAAFFASAQNVGIGTTTPLTKLHIANGASGATPFVFSRLAVESNGDTYLNLLSPAVNETAILFGQPGSAANGVIMYNTSGTSNGFQFRNNGNQTRMVIDNAGNVGIGTTSPAFPLSFGTALGDKISLWSNSSNSYGFGIQGGLLQIHTDISAADIAFGYGSSAAFTEKMRIKGDGNVGIGITTPTASLEVMRGTGAGGTAVFRGTTHMSHFNFGGNEDTYIRAGMNNRYVILNDIPGGKVGIGTTVPAATLEVNGYTKLGSDAPSIKVKKLTGTTAATQGSFVTIPLGLTPSKILSVSVIVINAAGDIVGPNLTWFCCNQFSWSIINSSGHVVVQNQSGNSSSILSTPIIISITYEE